MNSKEILQSIINEFDIKKFSKFFRSKNDKLKYSNEPIEYNDEHNFTEGRKIAEGELDDGELIVCSFLANQNITERSGKKAQYDLGKKILKEQQADAGIFIFYDPQGNFRFSLIYTNYLGKLRDWSNFKRFTYFVNPELTNKTFLKQISEGDFSTLGKIKEAFSVEPVTKQFYVEIQSWYFWAMDKIKFPDDYKYSNDPVKDKEIRNATNLIRLITRVIFIWFLKEKRLVPSELFLKEKLETIVRDFMKNKTAFNYYNAILQNLFFATLNQKMNERKFAENKGYPANKKEYGVKSLYRYEDKFLIDKNEVLKLFKDIPFLNGGLFDCLDKEDETRKVIYVDGFSRNPLKQAIIPDYLFFQKNEEKVDLSKYSLDSNRHTIRGLIEILNSYNFTIDENTPIDQEIALDPELLGKVFENLLASYNPETATTARKLTGSYYTPREIVDYMVEASICEYLKTKLPDIKEDKIKTLLSYSDDIPKFLEHENQKIIQIIDEIKVIDPACGSGAFPMGVLHKFVFVLQKLDPENKYWFELQYQKALKESEEVFKQDDKKQREERLKEINETFDENINYPDYARKLYLIENCIYGVDVQPIAIQISKLRFFISLILDQKIDREKDNFGIKALPNLETKFVSANTLIRLDKPNVFYNNEIWKLEDEIKSFRHKYFQSKTRKEKIDYQNKDKKLRELLASKLESIGFPIDSSEKIAKFDPFDQNASTNWFDPEWMFGVTDGFDVVIANPPYVRQEKIRKLKPLLKKQNYQVYAPRADIYTYFYEKSYNILKPGGFSCFISSNKWMRAKYGEKLRRFFKEKTTLKQIIDFNGYKVFNATVDTNILLFQKTKPLENIVYIINIQPDFTQSTDIANYFNSHKLEIKQSELDINCFTFGDETLMNLKAKIEKIGTPLKNWDVKIYYGIKTGFNEAFIITTEKRNEILTNCETAEERKRTEDIIKPILRGRDIYRYGYKWAGLWVIIVKHGFHVEIEKNYPAILNHLIKYKDSLQNRGQCKYSRGSKNYAGQHHWLELDNNPKDNYLNEFEKEKIVWREIVREPSFAYDTNYIYCEATSFLMTGKNLKYLIALLNSKPIAFFFKQFYAGGGLGGEGYRYKKAFLEQLPIPKISEYEQKPFIDLVDKILAITKDEDYLENPAKQAKVHEYEKQIDQLVYKLYGLTEEEIKIIEEQK